MSLMYECQLSLCLGINFPDFSIINLACVDVTHHVSESDTEVAPVGVLLMSTHDCVPVLLMLGYQLI